MKTHNVIIGVGSNINPEYNIALAEKEVNSLGVLKRKSNFIYTKPLLFETQNDFLNGVFYFETTHEKSELKKRLKDIELKLGRKRENNKNGPRTIDLDIVIYNNQIVDYDVFNRAFLKNFIVDLFPFFTTVLNCKNYMNNFDDINKVIEVVKSTLPENPISIFGAGYWFCDEGCNTSSISIIVIANKIDSLYESLIVKNLKILHLDKIKGFPVQIRFFWSEDLEGKLVKKCLAANNENTQRLFIKQFPFYKLLYGKPWQISNNLIEQLSID